jgi:hypothetical protein
VCCEYEYGRSVNSRLQRRMGEQAAAFTLKHYLMASSNCWVGAVKNFFFLCRVKSCEVV